MCVGQYERFRQPAGPVEIYQQIAAFGNELFEWAAHTVADRRSSRLIDFSERFAGLIATTPEELLELLQSAFDKLEEFGPVLGLELGGSQFVSKVGDFLSSMQACAAEIGGGNAKDSV